MPLPAAQLMMLRATPGKSTDEIFYLRRHPVQFKIDLYYNVLSSPVHSQIRPTVKWRAAFRRWKMQQEKSRNLLIIQNGLISKKNQPVDRRGLRILHRLLRPPTQPCLLRIPAIFFVQSIRFCYSLLDFLRFVALPCCAAYCLWGESYYAVLVSEWASECNNNIIRAHNELYRFRSDIPRP